MNIFAIEQSASLDYYVKEDEYFLRARLSRNSKFYGSLSSDIDKTYNTISKTVTAIGKLIMISRVKSFARFEKIQH